MAQNKNIFIKIQVDNKAAKSALDSTGSSIDNVSRSSDKLTEAKKRLAFELSNEGKELARLNASIKAQRAANDALTGSTIKSAVAEARATVRKREHQAEVKRLVYEMENAGKVAATYANRVQSTAKPFSMLNIGVQKNTKVLKANRSQTGLNNAILIETGRVASDAAYGMQGIANNLGRLIELGQEYSRTGQGGLLGAFKQLGKSLMGAGGLIIAIQLLLSFAPKIIKMFKGSAEAVETETDALIKNNKELDKQIARRKILAKNLDTVGDTFSDEFLVNLNNGLNLLNDTELALAELSERFEKAGVSGSEILKDETIAADARLEISYRLLDNARSENKLTEIRQSQDKEILQAKKDGRQVDALFIKDQSKNIIRVRKNIIETNKEIDRLKERGIVLTPADIATGSGSDEFKIKLFKEKLDDLSKLEDKYRRNSIDKDLMTEEEKIALQEEFNLRDLEIKQKAFEAKERLRLKNFKDQTEAQRKQELDSARKASEEAGGDPETLKAKELEINKKFDAAILDSEKTLQIELADSKRQAAEVEVQIKADTHTKLLKLDRKRAEDAKRELEQQIKIDRDVKNSRSLMEIQELTLVEDQKAATVLEGLLGLKRSELTIQGDLLNQKKAISDEEIVRLNGLLDNDELVGLQRSKIEQKLVKEQQNNTSIKVTLAEAEANAKVQALEVTTSAMNAFAKLVGENSVAGKALSVAATLISTYSAAQKAYESQFTPIPTPDSPVRGTIAAAAAVASGLANVKAILSVDPKGESSAKAKPSVQAPAFNVVGTSSTDQLAKAVSSQSEMPPIKAYVVGKEITHQQELDRNIVNTAGVG